MTGVLGGAGLSAPFVWGALGRRGSRALQACLFFSTLTRYPRLFADVSSQFFSYGESHPHPHPCFLRNSLLETWCCGAARNLGFRAQVSFRAPLFHLHFSLCPFLSLFSFLSRTHYPPPPLDLSRRADPPRHYFPRRVSRRVHPYFLASALVPEMFSTFDA